MNPESKLFLVLLAALFTGLGLTAYGLGLGSKPAYTVLGIMTFFAALRGLSLLWTGRD
jgi:hypothetical protein